MNEIRKNMSELSVEQLEELIQEAAKLRSEKLPPVSMDFPIGKRVEPVVDPRYWVDYDQFSGGALICLRHPGYGWMYYLIPPNERPRLIELMTHHHQNSEVPNQLPPNKLN